MADLEERLVREQPQPAKAEPDGAKRRAAVAKLRTEIELLQLEVAADKAQLVELMRAVRKAETRTVLRAVDDSIEPPMTAEEVVEILSKADSGDPSALAQTSRLELWLTDLASKAEAGDHVAEEIYTAFMGAYNQIANKGNDGATVSAFSRIRGEPTQAPRSTKADDQAKKGYEAEKKALEAAEKKSTEIRAKHRDELQTLLEQKKQHFARMLTELNEKRSALAEAEKPSGEDQ